MRTTSLVAPTLLFVAVSLSAVLFGGCKPKETGQIMEVMPDKQYDRPLPPGQLALRKITDPRDIPDFTIACENLSMLRQTIDGSIRYLNKPSSRAFFPYGEITHDHALNSLKAFANMLEGNPSPGQLNLAIREKFDVYTSVGWDGSGTVLFTGYYTPIFDASPTKTDRFKYPLYKQPDNLAKGAEGVTLGMKGPNGQVVPCPTRKEIDSSTMYAGHELMWLSDPFEVYIVHVQGSAKLRMPDGKIMTVGYTATNGYDYKSVAKEMIADGKMDKSKLSLQTMIAYFKSHPNEINEYTWRNPRYVFFAEIQGGPYGSLNEPVIPYRSIATDKSVYPRACLAFLSCSLPRRIGADIENKPYNGFALDQDTGGAIRAPGRTDIYIGVGDPAAELAGRTYTEGRLYYLFLKPTMATPLALPPMTDKPPVKMSEFK